MVNQLVINLVDRGTHTTAYVHEKTWHRGFSRTTGETRVVHVAATFADSSQAYLLSAVAAQLALPVTTRWTPPRP